jgi:hypothetical protein
VRWPAVRDREAGDGAEKRGGTREPPLVPSTKTLSLSPSPVPEPTAPSSSIATVLVAVTDMSWIVIRGEVRRLVGDLCLRIR